MRETNTKYRNGPWDTLSTYVALRPERLSADVEEMFGIGTAMED